MDRKKKGVSQNGKTPNIIGICSYCVLDRPVFEWNQVLLYPELTPWWSFLFADGWFIDYIRLWFGLLRNFFVKYDIHFTVIFAVLWPKGIIFHTRPHFALYGALTMQAFSLPTTNPFPFAFHVATHSLLFVASNYI